MVGTVLESLNKKDLELALELIPRFPSPREDLEQYLTPSDIAADILWHAYMHKDIRGKLIIDLGCGTGKLLFGALMLGARYGLCIDIDYSALQLARDTMLTYVNIPFDVIATDLRKGNPSIAPGEITYTERKVDCTVIMNPPFGVKSRKADFDFIRIAMEICDTIYSLHKNVPKSLEILGKICEEQNYRLFIVNEYRFPISWFLPKHREKKHIVNVVLVRLKRIL